MRVGMIGVGLMGHGIASNLVSKGHSLTFLHHLGNQPTSDLESMGAVRVATIAAVAEASEVVFLVVTGTPQVEEIVQGPGGLVENMRDGLLVVDCSTALPSSTEALAGAIERAGGGLVDAAMTRTPREAAEGRLNLLVGASADQFRQIEPLLRCFAENVTHAGSVGAGHRLKLLHNFVSLGTVTLMAEAFACAKQAGISCDIFLDTLAKGGGWGAALERLRPYVLEGQTEHFRFSLSNASKDIGYYRVMAAGHGVSMGVADGVLADLTGLVASGQGAALMPTLASLLCHAPRLKPS